MARTVIDLNSDCGESFGNWRMGNDAAVLTQVSSANVACGFHGSDPVTMRHTVDLALANGVRVGAHPGLPDLLGFGRREMAISPDDGYAYIAYQVGALQAFLTAKGATLQHVKPHGSLSNMLRVQAELADAVAAAVADTCDSPCLYCNAPVEDTALYRAAEKYRIPVVAEFYPDLGYDDNANVVIERHKAAASPEACKSKLARFLDTGTVETVTGNVLSLEAQSICVHGDAANASDIIAALLGALQARGLSVAAPAIHGG